MVGLTPSTLRDYCRKGRSTLLRGVDFGVRHPNRCRKELFFTERGIARLIARDYSPSHRGPAYLRHALKRALRDPLTYNVRERRANLEHNMAVAFLLYLKSGGCAVPNCPCAIHRLNPPVPQADYIRAVMEIRPGEYPVRERRRPPIMGGTPPAPRNAT